MIGRSGKPYIVILDNGAAEHQLITGRSLVDMCNQLTPDYLVVPDDMKSAANTLALARDFCTGTWTHYWNDMAGQAFLRPGLMVVPHGETFAEWAQNLDDLMALPVPGIDAVGVAKRHTLLSAVGYSYGRVELVNHVSKVYPKVMIHLLGIQHNPIEIMYLRNTRTYGIDTALPWSLARHGTEIGYVGLVERPAGLHSNEQQFGLTDETLNIAMSNISTIIQWAEGK
jgi:hypothetical protein